MKISARNQLKGTVQEVEKGAVQSIVTIKLSKDVIKATISNEAVADLGLAAGVEAYAIIKATSVLIATEVGKISARNVLAGTIKNIELGAVNDIVSLEIGDGSIVKATISDGAVKELGLAVGDSASAIIKATEVIVGVDH
jgi:molybdate transport system regulatory protein